MPFLASDITVAVTPTLLVDPRSASVSDPMPAAINNNGAATLFLGGSGVTTGTGFPIPAAGSITLQLISGDQVWGVSAAGGLDVRVLIGRS